jgi:cell division protein FtsW
MAGRSKSSKKIWPDRTLLAATLLLACFGLVMVFSSSAMMSEERYGSAYLFVRKQLAWDFLGLLALLVCTRIDYHRWQRWAYLLLGASVFGLVGVLAVGPVIKGARRWIHLGPISFQPSELAKLALILVLATFLDRHKSQVKDFQNGFVPLMLFIGLICGLIVLEPDLGSAVLLASVGLIMIFLAGARGLHLLSMVGAASVPLYFLLFHVGFRRRRLMAFMDPWADPQHAGYQITQSMMAFGSGGIWGKGLGASELKLLYLPDPHTDFIFPIIGEELGFIGAVAVILLFVFWGWRGWQTTRRAPDLFGQLLAAGITSWVLLQAMINMAVSCGLLPTKGLPLPFISFGGSSTVITMAAVGILLNISAQGTWEKIPEFRRHQRVRLR